MSGPDAYISPDWYGSPDQVPTWNYVAVNLRGTVARLEQGEMGRVLDALSAEFEGRLTPKPPWTAANMSEDAMQRLMRQIRPIVFEVSEIESTYKLGQNKDATARGGAATALGSDTPGQGQRTLARWMREQDA